MKNTATYFREQESVRVSVKKKFKDLVQLKKEGDQSAFNEQLLKVLPELRKYVNRRLNAAIHRGYFSKGKYKAEDFIDQLFIEVYDSIEDINNENDFYVWLFKKTNELLEETIVEEEFSDLFFKNIDDYSQPEWDEMVEKFTAEADGDLIMKEDLEDASYHNTKYILNHVFIEDNEKEFIEKLDEKLSDEDIDRHIKMVLHNLPHSMQTVFELFTNQSFTLGEIAEITKRSVKEIEWLLRDARKGIYKSLFNLNLGE